MPQPDSPQAEPAALWVLTNDASKNWLYRIDPVSLAIERRTELAYAGVLWEIAGSSQTIAYTIDREMDRLITIDLVAGTIATSAQLGGDMKQNGRGFGVSPDGTLLGIFSGVLEAIDPQTGALSHPVTVQLGLMAESLEACGQQLYMASRESGSPRGEKLYAIDATGHSTLRGTIGATPIDIDTLACFAGRLYGVDSDPTLGRTLYEIDPATGNASQLLALPVAGTINGVHATAPVGAI